MNDAAATLGQLFERVLEVSWQSVIIVALIVLTQWLFRHHISANWRFILWSALVVRLIAFWQIPAPMSVSEGVPSVWHAIVAGLDMPSQPVVADTSPEAGQPTAILPTATAVANVDAAPRAVTWQIAAVVWLVGAIACALAIVGNGIAFGRRVRRVQVPIPVHVAQLFETCKQTVGIRRPISLIASQNISIPALFGAIRPCVLVPLELLQPEHEQRLRYMFLHELAHVKRHDVAFGWLLYLPLSLHWFNPVLWRIAKRIVADRELACDAHVLSLLTAVERHAYGNALLDQLKKSQVMRLSPSAAGILEHKTNIERRIAMLASYKKTSRLSDYFSMFACVVFAAIAIAGAEEKKQTLSIASDGIIAFVAPNGGTMLAATITNAGASDVEASVTFYEGDPDKDGKKLGDGALEISAGKTGTEAIMWVVTPGSHHIVAVVATEDAVGKQSAQRIVACRKRNGEITFEYKAVQGNESNNTSQTTDLRAAILDVNRVLQETGFQREELDALQKQRDELQLSVDKQSDELKKEMEAVQLLSEKEREAKSDELQKKIREFRAQFQNWQAETDKSFTKIMDVVRARMEKEASAIAARDGYDGVINSRGHSVIWQKDGFPIDTPESITGTDITAEIIKSLKQQKS